MGSIRKYKQDTHYGTKTTVEYKGMKVKTAYVYNAFHGELSKKNIKDFYFIARLSKTKIELSNGIGSFIAYLNPREAMKLGVEGLRNYVKEQQEKLIVVEQRLKSVKSR